MDPRDWIEAFATELGADPPDKGEMDEVLELAGTAAHASARLAAPVACWIAGRAGATLQEAHDAAARVATRSG